LLAGKGLKKTHRKTLPLINTAKIAEIAKNPN
jgi:hypothetical protein